MLHEEINCEAWNKLIKRDLLINYQIKFKEGILFEDVIFIYRLFSIINTLVLGSNVTYYYRSNPSGIMAQSLTEKGHKKAIESYITIYEYMLKNPPILNSRKLHLTPNYLLFIHKHMIKGLYIANLKEASKEQKKRLELSRNNLMRNALKFRQPIPALFCLLFYNPLKRLILYSWFRKSYHYILKIILTLSIHSDFSKQKQKQYNIDKWPYKDN